MLFTVTFSTPETQFRIDLILFAEPQLSQPGTVKRTVFKPATAGGADNTRQSIPINVRIHIKRFVFIPTSNIRSSSRIVL